jgi:hypothetical protein
MYRYDKIYFTYSIKFNYGRSLVHGAETHKFVIMDFEFSSIDRYSKILISGAISNSLDRFKISKLEGRPLYLPRGTKRSDL